MRTYPNESSRGFDAPPPVASGKLYEHKVLGSFYSPRERDYIEQLKKEKQRLDATGERLRKDVLIDLIREYAGDDPEDPRQPTAKDLRIEVLDFLESQQEDANETQNTLRYYTAVGTPLDEFFGIDAWLEYETPEGTVMVTIDITLDPEKLQHGYKADVIVGQIVDPKLDEDAYLDEIEMYAKRLGSILAERTH